MLLCSAILVRELIRVVVMLLFQYVVFLLGNWRLLPCCWLFCCVLFYFAILVLVIDYCCRLLIVFELFCYGLLALRIVSLCRLLVVLCSIVLLVLGVDFLLQLY